MLNYIWSFLFIIGLLVAGFVGKLSGDGSVMGEAFTAASNAVMVIALPLAGMMMFWMGTLRLLEKAGVLEAVVRFFSPILSRLFPEVPKGHPALGAMVMNWCANMLGLGNAATPLGLKAMNHLQDINPHKQSASNSMVTFLALNTSGFALIPMTAIIYLTTAGVPNASRIIAPAIIATAIGTMVAVIAARTFQRVPGFAQQPDVEESAAEKTEDQSQGMSSLARTMLAVLALLFAGIAALELGPREWRESFRQRTGIGSVLDASETRAKEAKIKYEALKKEKAAQAVAAPVEESFTWRKAMDGASALALPAVLLAAIGLSLARRVKVYEEFIEGAKEGFGVATRIMPFLVAMLAMLAVLRASGVFALLEAGMAPLLTLIGFPVELLSLGLMRPLSGSGASGILMEILTRPDLGEQVKFTAAILYGSTETTFYVLAVYFGSVGIRKIRHALLAGLIADFAGMTAAVVIGKLMF